MTRTAYLELIGKHARKNEEEQLQRAIVEHLRLRAPRDVLWWHTPNGGARSKSDGGKFKALGVRPGVPDLQFLFPDGHVAFLELKAGDGKLSPEQTNFLIFCDRAGVEAAVAYNIDQALTILEVWGALKPESA